MVVHGDKLVVSDDKNHCCDDVELRRLSGHVD